MARPMKVCSKCKIPKDLENDFHKCSRSKDGRQGRCKTCNIEGASRWNVENRERYNANIRRWHKKHPERVRATAQKRRALLYVLEEHYTAAEWEALVLACGGVCVACGSDDRLTVDHIVPLCRGGKNTIDNIQPLCRSCNSKKATQIINYLEDRNIVLPMAA